MVDDLVPGLILGRADLARLPQLDELLESGVVRPLRGLIANAGLSVADTRNASADGYELTFAVNYLAHARLIGDLLDSFATPARIVLVGSNTYYANWVRRLMSVPAAEWRDPLELAKPARPEVSPTLKAAGVAYSNSKLAILYYSHELQRRAPEGINVAVFEPGFMPGTGLSRQHSPWLQRMGRGMERLPPWHFVPREIRARACFGDSRRTVGTPPRWRLRGHRQGPRRHAHREQPRPGAPTVGGHSQASAAGNTSRQPGFQSFPILVVDLPDVDGRAGRGTTRPPGASLFCARQRRLNSHAGLLTRVYRTQRRGPGFEMHSGQGAGPRRAGRGRGVRLSW
jgi:NAD(P)-dependent dehydrogenase (short-subunit alcohol dehydrogenase family)